MIGRNCRIGRGAHITGCYLLDNVSVGDQAQVSHSLLCNGVSVGAHAMVFPGSVLSFRVSTATASPQHHEAGCGHQSGSRQYCALLMGQSCTGLLWPRVTQGTSAAACVCDSPCSDQAAHVPRLLRPAAGLPPAAGSSTGARHLLQKKDSYPVSLRCSCTSQAVKGCHGCAVCR